MAAAQSRLAETMQWTDHMAATMLALHGAGVTRGDIEAALDAVPMPAPMAAALKAAARAGDQIWVISDANTVFIERILEVHGLGAPVVTGIKSNPAAWSPDGLLEITRLVPASGPPHGCTRCARTPNMCKGQLVSELIAAAAPSTVIYCGDGGNDFCPSIALGPTDLVLARTGYRLATMLRADAAGPGLVNAEVIEWRDYQTVARYLNPMTRPNVL